MAKIWLKFVCFFLKKKQVNIVAMNREFFYVEVKTQSYGNERISQKGKGSTVLYKDRSVVLEEGQLEEQRYTFKLNFISGTGLNKILNLCRW